MNKNTGILMRIILIIYWNVWLDDQLVELVESANRDSLKGYDLRSIIKPIK